MKFALTWLGRPLYFSRSSFRISRAARASARALNHCWILWAAWASVRGGNSFKVSSASFLESPGSNFTLSSLSALKRSSLWLVPCRLVKLCLLSSSSSTEFSSMTWRLKSSMRVLIYFFLKFPPIFGFLKSSSTSLPEKSSLSKLRIKSLIPSNYFSACFYLNLLSTILNLSFKFSVAARKVFRKSRAYFYLSPHAMSL